MIDIEKFPARSEDAIYKLVARELRSRLQRLLPRVPRIDGYPHPYSEVRQLVIFMATRHSSSLFRLRTVEPETRNLMEIVRSEEGRLSIVFSDAIGRDEEAYALRKIAPSLAFVVGISNDTTSLVLTTEVLELDIFALADLCAEVAKAALTASTGSSIGGPPDWITPMLTAIFSVAKFGKLDECDRQTLAILGKLTQESPKGQKNWDASDISSRSSKYRMSQGCNNRTVIEEALKHLCGLRLAVPAYRSRHMADFKKKFIFSK